MGELGSDVGADGGLEGDDIVEDAEGVFSHFVAGEELGDLLGEIQAELHGVGGNGDANVVVGEQEAAVAVGDGAAGVKEPGGGAGGIHVEELEELFLEAPEALEAVLGNAEGAEMDERLEEGEVGSPVYGRTLCASRRCSRESVGSG